MARCRDLELLTMGEVINFYLKPRAAAGQPAAAAAAADEGIAPALLQSLLIPTPVASATLEAEAKDDPT